MLMCVFMDLCFPIYVCVCAMSWNAFKCMFEGDSGLSHVRPSCMYSSEPGERLSEQVNNHI